MKKEMPRAHVRSRKVRIGLMTMSELPNEGTNYRAREGQESGMLTRTTRTLKPTGGKEQSKAQPKWGKSPREKRSLTGLDLGA